MLNCLKDEGSIINKTRRRKTITYNSPKGCMKQTQMEMVGMSGQFGHRQSHSGHGQSHLGKIMVNVDHTE